MRLKYLFILSSAISCLSIVTALNLMFLSCAANQIKYSDPIEILYDNFWINENTLQIQVQYNSTEALPYTMRRESSCGKAKEMIDAHVETLYPSIKGMPYKVNIYKTMYHKKVDCQLVVHVSMPNLKSKLKNKETK